MNNSNQVPDNFTQQEYNNEYKLDLGISDIGYGQELGNMFSYTYPQRSPQSIPQCRPKTFPYSEVMLPLDGNIQLQDARDTFNIMASFPQYFLSNDSGLVYMNRKQPPNIYETNGMISESTSIPSQQYPDLTSLINSNSNIIAPSVEHTFIDYKACKICGKKISRDMLRHMRTHQPEGRFRCNFPQRFCNHKSRKFNRPYDHKKHLLNRHFIFDLPEIKRLHNLNDKLKHTGTCPCGARYVAKEWLENHILTSNVEQRCRMIE